MQTHLCHNIVEEHDKKPGYKMIIFELKCGCGCLFDGWFQNRDDFDKQLNNSLMACPECGGTNIHKILSPVAIHARTSSSQSSAPTSGGTEQDQIRPESALQFLRSVQDFVENNFDDVGPKLAEESLKIHYGVAKPRNIRGVATEAEEHMLGEEGIELLKIPVVRKDNGSKLN